jgi:ABC-2 type transport system permease protein
MFSKSLLKKTLRDSWKLWAIITGVLMLFIFILLRVQKGMQDGMGQAATGGGAVAASVLNQFYSMFAIILPLIFITSTANKLIAAKVDNGSLGYIMANPIRRNQVSLTQGLYLIGSVIAMVMLIALSGFAAIQVTGVEMDTGAFLLLNLGLLSLLLADAGIAFCASCVFNRSAMSTAIGAGIPISFFLFTFLGGFEDMAKILGLLKYISLNTLFNIPDALSKSNNVYWQFGILLAVAAASTVGGIVYFKKKDLPL